MSRLTCVLVLWLLYFPAEKQHPTAEQVPRTWVVYISYWSSKVRVMMIMEAIRLQPLQHPSVVPNRLSTPTMPPTTPGHHHAPHHPWAPPPNQRHLCHCTWCRNAPHQWSGRDVTPASCTPWP